MGLHSSGLVERTQRYWELSRAWRGDINYSRGLTIGDLGRALQVLATSCGHKSNHKLEEAVSNQLREVIVNKKNRKTKPVNNLIALPMIVRQGTSPVTSQHGAFVPIGIDDAAEAQNNGS